jgi:apolipoprotein N-acyltransferase
MAASRIDSAHAESDFLSFPDPLSRFAFLIAFACGALNVLSFAPFGLWPMQIATLALVFRLALIQPSAKRAAFVGGLYGFGWLLFGVCWLFVSMHDYGDMPSWMAALGVILLAAGMAVFPFAAIGLSVRLHKRAAISIPITVLAVFPAFWALCEWMRGWFLTGFPWIVSGYAHTASPLAGYAPLIGVYGIAWISALISGCIALLPSRKSAAVVAVALLASGYVLNTIQWTKAHGEPLSVRLLQGNVPQEMKFEAESLESTLIMYRDMIEAAPADMIATPETALPEFQYELPPYYLAQLGEYAHKMHSYLVIGIPLSEHPGHYANGVIGIAPRLLHMDTRAYQYHYEKHHLVPFGEFIPYGFRWFVDMMKMPLGDFSPAPVLQPPFEVKGQWIQPNICYEDLFGEEIAQQLRSGPQPATILLNMSNIGWFGNSIALPQHLQISQMRAMETGRPMLRATNTGITAAIDPKGRVMAQLPPFQRGTLKVSVQGYEGMTPYVLYGNAPIAVLAILVLIASVIFARKAQIRVKNR